MDDLRAYAETILGCVAKSETEHGTEYVRDVSLPGFGLMEPYELAAAYLRDNPDDGGEPADAGWFEQFWPFEEDSDDAYAVFRPCATVEIRVSLANGMVQFNGHWLGSEGLSVSRKQARRLLAALGVGTKDNH